MTKFEITATAPTKPPVGLSTIIADLLLYMSENLSLQDGDDIEAKIREARGKFATAVGNYIYTSTITVKRTETTETEITI